MEHTGCLYIISVVIKHVISKFSTLNNKHLFSHTVSVNQESRKSLAGWFWFRV